MWTWVAEVGIIFVLILSVPFFLLIFEDGVQTASEADFTTATVDEPVVGGVAVCCVQQADFHFLYAVRC